MSYPHGSLPHADLAASTARPPSYTIGTGEGRLFVAAEIEVYRPGGAVATAGHALAEAAHADVPPVASVALDSDVIRASDIGYVTPLGSLAGTLPYLATLDQTFSVNRVLDLQPGGAGASVAWGALRLINDARRYDVGASGRNVDSRSVRVLMGRKTLDRSRGRFVDPPYGDLAEIFAGLAQSWQPDDTGLTIPLRDATVWTERPLQSSSFVGTGGLEGTADLKGRPKPKARGGTTAAPVLNVSPLLLDPVNNIWQYSDAAGTIVALYEDGAPVFTYAGDTANLYAGSTPAGNYRSDNAGARFQLGSPNAGRITADVTGSFPLAGLVSTAPMVALKLLIEDLAVPPGSVDEASFVGLSAAAGYEAGWYWDGLGDVAGADAVGLFLAAIGGRIVPTRTGKLRAILLRAPAVGVVPAATYTDAQIVSVRRMTLPAGCSPPPYRLRWGYQRNHTILDTDIGATVTDTRRQFLRTNDRLALWSSAGVLTAWRRPSDPQPIGTALGEAADAQAVVDAMGALWGTERRLFAVDLPAAIGVAHELGDAIVVAYPLDDLDNGKLGIVVGEALRIGDGIASLQVLI